MPLYEYECRHCGTKIEKLESMTAPREQDCGACETPLGLHRITSLTSFSLSGDAWYSGGYSRESNTPAPTTKAETAPASSPNPTSPTSPPAATSAPAVTPSGDKKP